MGRGHPGLQKYVADSLNVVTCSVVRAGFYSDAIGTLALKPTKQSGSSHDTITPPKQQAHHSRQQVHPRQAAAPGVPGAGPPRNPANAVVALAAVPGSRSVETPATQRLSTHGPRASRPAKVLRSNHRKA